MSSNAQTAQLFGYAMAEGWMARFNAWDWTGIKSTTYVRFLIATFVTLSSADFVLTKLLLQGSSGEIYESNPLADFVLHGSGWLGLALFKTALVGLISGVILYIEPRKPKAAHRLAAFACLVTSGVVVYSVCLGILFI
jgi:hypothetical protein